jgi:hypothetical protein
MGFHGVEDILEAEVTDLAQVPEIGEAASTIIEAARGEMVRRQVPAAPAPTESAVATA